MCLVHKMKTSNFRKSFGGGGEMAQFLQLTTVRTTGQGTGHP